jgi:hypothetical protein
MSDTADDEIAAAELDAWIESLPCKWPECRCNLKCKAEKPTRGLARPSQHGATGE